MKFAIICHSNISYNVNFVNTVESDRGQDPENECLWSQRYWLVVSCANLTPSGGGAGGKNQAPEEHCLEEQSCITMKPSSSSTPPAGPSAAHFLLWSFSYQKWLSLSENKSTFREKLFRKHVPRFHSENLNVRAEVGNLRDPPAPSLEMVWRTSKCEMSWWYIWLYRNSFLKYLF